MLMIKLRALFSTRYTYLGLLSVVVAVVTNLFSSLFIWRTYGDALPVAPDLLLDILPSIRLAWLYNGIVVLGFVSFFLLYAYREDFAGIPFFLLLVGLFYIARGVGIVLTPVAYPSEPFTDFLLIKAFRFGVNPSGHSGSLFLFSLLARGRYRDFFLILTVVDSILMLLGSAHYSIDIFASFFFSYAVWSFGQRHLGHFRLREAQAGLRELGEGQ